MKGESWLAGSSALLASCALALAGLFPGNNPDTFGHLAQGRQIAALGHVPRLDTWSLLPDPPHAWLNYEWLSDLGTYLLYARFGYPAVTLFKCLLLFISVLCLVRTAQLLGGARAAVLTSLTLIGTIPAIRMRLSDRPHVLGLCLAAAYLLLLTGLSRQHAAGERRKALLSVACLAALHLIWVNAHGSHLLGLALTVSFLVLGPREARRWYGAAVALQLLASCVSPYGPAIWLDALDHVSDSRYRKLIGEWQPWRESDPAWLSLGPALQGALLALLLPRLWRSPHAARAALPIALLLAVACFRSIRFVPEFMLLSAPLVGLGAALSLRDVRLPTFAGATGVALTILLAVVSYGSTKLPPHASIGARMSLLGLPSAAGSVLRQHGLRPRVFAAMEDSWYLMFAAPNSRFVVDGRVPFYGASYIERVQRAFASPYGLAQLERELAFDVVVVNHSVSGEQQVCSYLAHTDGWQLLLIEDLHATYTRPSVLDAKGSRTYPPISALEPGYPFDWLLRADAAQVARIREELAHLSRVGGTSGYRAWVEGVLALAALHRGAAADGFRWPRDDAEWEQYRNARLLIQHAASKAPEVPIVSALDALLAAIFCDFSAADAALERALVGGASREPLMAALELALRRGQREKVQAVLSAARANPRASRDPWLAELAGGLENAPACPK